MFPLHRKPAHRPLTQLPYKQMPPQPWLLKLLPRLLKSRWHRKPTLPLLLLRKFRLRLLLPNRLHPLSMRALKLPPWPLSLRKLTLLPKFRQSRLLRQPVPKLTQTCRPPLRQRPCPQRSNIA
jgi:hypothetical protein